MIIEERSLAAPAPGSAPGLSARARALTGGSRLRLVTLVVINLVGNAVKFTPVGGRVRVALRVDDDGIVIEVSDTGIGIPRHEQERLFSRFFRSTLAQEQAIPGSGLGLSIAHAIVEKHGGTMSVESEPGTGTTFSVHLPPLTAA